MNGLISEQGKIMEITREQIRKGYSLTGDIPGCYIKTGKVKIIITEIARVDPLVDPIGEYGHDYDVTIMVKESNPDLMRLLIARIADMPSLTSGEITTYRWRSLAQVNTIVSTILYTYPYESEQHHPTTTLVATVCNMKVFKKTFANDLFCLVFIDEVMDYGDVEWESRIYPPTTAVTADLIRAAIPVDMELDA